MAFKEQPFFRYEPLGRSQPSFRLCRLLPDEFEAPIQCELTNELIAPLEGLYSALSYTWGKPSEQRWIRLNKKPFHIQPNLLLALKAIRRRKEPLLVWIDAICIKQLDIAERNYQVSLMANIYRNAARVLAWLGPEGDDSNLVFDYIGRCNLLRYDKAILHQQTGTGAEEDDVQQGPSLAANMNSDVDSTIKWNFGMDEQTKRAFNLLNERPYWRRAWIKQEIILAKHIIVYCGSRCADWFSFSFWASLKLIKPYDEHSDSYISELFAHRDKLENGESQTLEELLHRYLNTDATDPRDRIYAFLSLASDCEGRESEITDYNLSRPALFFALLAHFKPAHPAKLATILQEALHVRRVQLMKFWNDVPEESGHDSTSYGEKTACDYIRQLKKYRQSSDFSVDLKSLCGSESEADLWISGLPSKTPPFIFLSCLAAATPLPQQVDKEALCPERDSLFQIDGTRFCVRAKPTLFGFKFCKVYKSTGDNTWQRFDPSFTEAENWVFTVLPKVLLSGDSEFLQSKFLDDVKDTVAAKYGVAALKPDIENILCTLTEFAQSEEFKDLCIVDCRYVLTTVYYYRILRPVEVQ